MKKNSTFHRRERGVRREFTAISLQHFVYYTIAIFANFVYYRELNCYEKCIFV